MIFLKSFLNSVYFNIGNLILPILEISNMFTAKTRGMYNLYLETVYDAVSDVVESGVHWRSNFQIGSGVLKNCYRPNLMHIYGTQCDFMHRSC